jgi:hypothetical protein
MARDRFADRADKAPDIRVEVAPAGRRRFFLRVIHGSILGSETAVRRRQAIVCHREWASLG